MTDASELDDIDEARRPHGKAEVMAAIRAAAAELLAERGPRDITVRDVAERAGVNHALVHRHFGTKDELIRGVIAELSAAIGQAAAALGGSDVAALLRLLREQPAYWNILARTILDAPEVLAGYPPPAASIVLAMVSAGREPDDEMRATAAVAGSLVLGWIVFGQHLGSVLNLSETQAFDDAVAAEVRRILKR
jgi:AcrR family transcriptional regulator